MTSPGIYPRISAADYHAWDALSSSGLNALLRSPAHFRAYRDERYIETPAMRFGRAVHAAILEPEVYGGTYVVAPELDRRTKDGKAVWQDLVGQYGEAQIVSADDAGRIEAMRKSVWSKKLAVALLGSEGDVELSALWTETVEGSTITCKARADRMSWKYAGGTIVDLKTTTDARRDAFERRIFGLGYHRQGAWYLRGFRDRGVAVENYAILAVEKDLPYEAQVYRLTEGALEAGWDQIESVLGLYARCRDADNWPGYPDEVVDIALPSWAWRVIDEEILMREAKR